MCQHNGPASAVEGLVEAQEVIHPADGQPEETVQPADAMQVRDTVQSADNAQPEDAVKPEDTVQPAGIVQPTTVSPPNPNKLSPTNFAKKDAEFSIKQFVTKDQTIESADSDMLLKWNGKSDQTLKVVKGDQEKLSFEFTSIVKIAYQSKEQYLQIHYTDNVEQIVVLFMSVPPNSWSELQQFCRRVEKKWKIPCDMQEPSFFKGTIENWEKIKNKKKNTYLHTPERRPSNRHIGESDRIPHTASSQKLKRHTSLTKQFVQKLRGASPNSQNAFTPTKKDKETQHFTPEVISIMAAKLRDKPLTLPKLSTPRKPYCPTDNLLSRTRLSNSISPQKTDDESKAQEPQAVNETEEYKAEDLKGRGSPVHRSLSIHRRRFVSLEQNPTETGSPLQCRPPSSDGSLFRSPNLSSPLNPTTSEATKQT